MARKSPAARKASRVAASGKVPFANSQPEPDMFYHNGKETDVSNASVDKMSLSTYKGAGKSGKAPVVKGVVKTPTSKPSGKR